MKLRGARKRGYTTAGRKGPTIKTVISKTYDGRFEACAGPGVGKSFLSQPRINRDRNLSGRINYACYRAKNPRKALAGALARLSRSLKARPGAFAGVK